MARKNRNKAPGANNSNSNSNSSSNSTDYIIRFKIPKLNETEIKAKFKDDGDEEVTEIVHVYHEGDNDYNLISLMKTIIELGDTYNAWEEGRSKRLA